ncbi:hypothetical protein A1351_16665 [Methylosinus sp. R-45379]|uniref:hypothetical protein n=1 Tax=unclassified Methylosinus TaxID=2624500 RepID=UPI00055DFDA6|nr:MULTISPECIES: hypothetical protein [unclassified Methylosinus]OAI25188.1 hypothetical protein A1351_16665 [Methylosinus sp. R-45379]TDX62006.1 hypothetical protein EDE12_112108 [Methylosinus sp. sav-2]
MQRDDLSEVREFADRLRDSLPTSVDVAALGVRSKAPMKLLCAREALIWRTEELSRNACDAIERNDFAVAAILCRAITESSALAWRLMEALDDREKHSASEFDAILMRLLMGSRLWEDFPEAFNVLTCIDRVDKQIPGIRASYDSLCEFAHPNWRGVFGLYSDTDYTKMVTTFGRGMRGAEQTKKMLINSVLGSLGVFEYAYNRISDIMPTFIGELDGIWSNDEDQSALE